MIPPSVDFRIPIEAMVSCDPTPLASPVARYMIWLLCGLIAISEHPMIGKSSVLEVQLSPPSIDFHSPPNGETVHMMSLLTGSNLRKLTLAAPEKSLLETVPVGPRANQLAVGMDLLFLDGAYEELR